MFKFMTLHNIVKTLCPQWIQSHFRYSWVLSRGWAVACLFVAYIMRCSIGEREAQFFVLAMSPILYQHFENGITVILNAICLVSYCISTWIWGETIVPFRLRWSRWQFEITNTIFVFIRMWLCLILRLPLCLLAEPRGRWKLLCHQ